MHPSLAEARTDAENDLLAKLGEARMGIDQAEHLRRIERIMKLGLDSLASLNDMYLGAHFTLVGSGPSAAGTIDRMPGNSIVVAVNGSHDWLIERGIVPKYAILMDPNPWVSTYQTPHPDVTYLVGTSCHHSVWARFFDAGVRPLVFIPMLDDDDHKTISPLFPGQNLSFVAGHTTTGLRAIYIIAGLGGAMVDMHGFDSCYEPGTVIGGPDEPVLYAHPKPRTHHDARELDVVSRGTGHRFRCRSNASFSRQALLFQSLCAALGDMGACADLDHPGMARPVDLSLRIFGDGAIPWMAWKDGAMSRRFWHAEPARMHMKYGVNPAWNYHLNGPFKNPETPCLITELIMESVEQTEALNPVLIPPSNALPAAWLH